MKPDSVLRITSALNDLVRLYPWLDKAMAGTAVSADLLTRMQVVLEEVAANIAMHGFDQGTTGRIAVTLRHAGNAFELVVEDDGISFDPTTVRPQAGPASPADVQPGGLGLRIVQRFCGSIAYQRVGGHNRLTLRFPVAE